MTLHRLSKFLLALFTCGCLTLLALFLGLIFIFFGNKKLFVIPPPSKPNKVSTQDYHLTPKNKEISSLILLISDTESDFYNTQKVLETKDRHNFSALINLGDITHLGVYDDFTSYKKLIDESGIKAYSVPGDRDLWKGKGVGLYNKVLGANYQSVILGNAKLLLIDNADEYSGIDDKQWEYISKEVNDADFVFLHNPIHKTKSLLFGTKGMGEYSDDVEKQRNRLLSLIRKSDVKAVFSGDRHIFSHFADKKKDDLNYFVIGSVNGDKSIGRPTYAILTIYEDGDYYVREEVL